MRDWELTVRVRRAVVRDPDLSTLNLEVMVQQGVATLSGPVPSEACRQRAAIVAKRVAGVRDVRNLLRIRPDPYYPPAVPIHNPEAPTHQPAAPARAALRATDVTFGLRRLLSSNRRFDGVTFSLVGGAVTLSGSVETGGDLEDLVRAIKQLDGIIEVQAQLVTVRRRG